MTQDLETYRPKWAHLLMQRVYVYLMTLAIKLLQIMWVKIYLKRYWGNRSVLTTGTSTTRLFLSEFNETWIFSKDFRKILNYQILWKSVHWKPSYMRTNRQTWRISWTFIPILITRLKTNPFRLYVGHMETIIVCPEILNPLKTKRRQLYLKTQFVPRSKHFPSRL